ncbi:TORC_N domain-containing protein [Meloidogyne graminicola]|uniref:TORC_N domain-containing protein n=1 Tax=Meloidogyne graminicola TaxID=189291 RepID=A0A8S9ZXW6_9BILA|nr:TORC_N domain-containing protein [Meloidogyne graminicola]
MSQATPRKFSEKIAILERKQNEEQEQFNNVMRDVRTITSNDVQQHRSTPQSSPQQLLNYGPQSNESSSKLSPEGPHPLTINWNRAGGSLPNVHQMVIQQPAMGSTPPLPYTCAVSNNYCWSPSWTNVQTTASNQFQQQQRAARTRSPGATHFHPYRNGTSPNGCHEPKIVNGGNLGGIHLQPPDPTWSKTRSDPAIHSNISTTVPTGIDQNFMSYQFYPEQNSWNLTNETKMFNGPSTAPPSAQIHPPVLFFPSYPLGHTNMPLNAQNSINQQLPNRQQQNVPTPQNNQMFNQPANFSVLPSVSLSQQISSSASCSSPVPSCSSQPNFIINNGNSTAQQFILLQQLNNNNNENNLPPKIKTLQGNNEQQQQQLMLENNRIALQQQQQQQLYNNTKISPPLSYFNQNIVTAPTTFQQQQLTTPLSNLLSQSRSAPSSPTTLSSSSSTENYHPLSGVAGGGKIVHGRLNQWSQHRHFSASPDGMEVPNICVTGTDGSLDVDCFQDLQDLHLDSETLQMLKDQVDHEHVVDPACETQLLS